MTTPAILRRRRDPTGDGLATAIFVVALIHGLVILGVRFSAPQAANDALPTLEVLLVPAGPDDPQENADAAYIAPLEINRALLKTLVLAASLDRARSHTPAR